MVTVPDAAYGPELLRTEKGGKIDACATLAPSAPGADGHDGVKVLADRLASWASSQVNRRAVLRSPPGERTDGGRRDER